MSVYNQTNIFRVEKFGKLSHNHKAKIIILVNKMKSISRWLCKNSTKNMFVKIVHPGGHVELHDRPILAAELLARNPKCCVALPTVFQHPHALVSPETTLLLGHKYFVVPLATIRKLQLKHRRGGGGGDPTAVDSRPRTNSDRDREVGSSSSSTSSCWLFRSGKIGEEKSGGGLATAKNTGVEETAQLMMRERDRERKGKKEGNGNGNGNGNGHVSSSSSPGRISLLSVDNWHPGLHSICEEY